MSKNIYSKAISIFLLAGMIFGLVQPIGALAFQPARSVEETAETSPALQEGITLSYSDPVEAKVSQPLRDLPLAEDLDITPGEINPLRNPGLERRDLGLNGSNTNIQDPLAADGLNQGLTPAPLMNFAGMGNFGILTPPDTTGDVGPNHYMQIVNVSFAIWDKTGTLLGGPWNNNTLWSGFGGPCEVDNSGDPIVLYDDMADRWMISQFAVSSGLHMCLAVSTTPDPLGTYYLYGFPMPDFPDYPKFGVWPDGYYLSTNTGFPNQYYAHAFDRVSMLAGLPSTLISFGGIANFLMPADADGLNPPPPGSPEYFYTFYKDGYPDHPPGVDRLSIYEFVPDYVTPGNSTFTLVTELPIAAFNYTVCGFFVGDCIPQPGTMQGLDSLSYWPMVRLQYRNFGSHETLVGNFTVDLDGTDKAAIRWFELRKSGANPWSLYQEGTYAPDTDHRWMGSIAMDGSGNIALGYSVSSSTTIPAIRYATRSPGDPLGTLQAEESLIEGGGVQTGIHRWGDYSAMNVDPVDQCTFWMTNEYHEVDDAGFSWDTRIGTFKVPGCGGPSGTLEGMVDDGTDPIENASVVAENITATIGTTTDASGNYGMILPVGDYDVTASAYGYTPSTVSGVSIISGTVTVQDFTLTPATFYTVDGYVTDLNTGWPLYASLDIDGYPGDPIWTDPVSGYYSISLPEGITFTFDVDAWVGGYLPDSRDVGPLTGDIQEDFALDVDISTCTAPGYYYDAGASFFDNFESGYTNWTMSGLWNAEAEGDTCGSLVAPFPSPTNASYYGQDGVCNYDTGAANDGTLTMNTDFSLTGSGILRFSSYEETECGGICPWDKKWVEISDDSGVSWTTLGEGDTEGAWYQKEYDLSAYAGEDVRVQFRFEAVDSIGNAYFGWMVDDVLIGELNCVPAPGGLVVGNVYDDNTMDGLVGAEVDNDEGLFFVTEATPDDPAVDDGFYTLFGSPGSQYFTATMTGGYAPDMEMVAVVDGDTVGQDFYLPAGLIDLYPDSLEVWLITETLVYTDPMGLDIINVGGLDLDFEITEMEGGFAPPIVSIPPSDGIFPTGEFAPSFGAAPIASLAGGVPLSSPLVPLGTLAFATDAVNGTHTQFDLDIPEVLPNLGPFVPADFPGAGEYVNGYVYVADVLNNLYQLDPATGAILSTIPITAPPGGETYTGFAIDPTTGVLYASSTSIVSSSLFEVDVTTGVSTLIGPITNSACNIALAIDGAGDMWAYDICIDSFMSIDKATGAGTVIGSIGFDANFGQGMAWDPATDQVYLAAFNGGAFQAELRIADTSTGNTTFVGVLGSTTPGGLTQLPYLGVPVSSPDVPWVWEDPISGTVPSLDMFNVDIMFTALEPDMVTPMPFGTYTATLKLQNNTPYTGTPMLPVTMHIVDAFVDPVPSFVSNEPVSYGETMVFTNTSVDGVPSVEYFVWDFGDGITMTLNTFDGVTHDYASSGIFNVTLTAYQNQTGLTFMYTDAVEVEALEADVEISKLDNPDPVVPGGTLTYDLMVTNNGPDMAHGVMVVDTLPAGVTFVSASVGCVEAAGVVTCDIGDIALGNTEAVTIVVTAPADIGLITNMAEVIADSLDADMTNNTISEDTMVGFFTFLPVVFGSD
jgi:uncharacterized repeat protein (TIGR01451 family)